LKRNPLGPDEPRQMAPVEVMESGEGLGNKKGGTKTFAGERLTV